MLRDKCLRGLVYAIMLSVLLSGCGLMKAEMKLLAGKYSEAIPLYEEYLAKHSDSVQARNRLGFAYLKTGQLDRAMNELETVLKEEPGNGYAIMYLGMVYLNKGELEKTISTWQTYRDENKPLVEAQIKRLITVVQIAESQKFAKKALMEEKRLEATKPDANALAVCYYEDLSPDKSLRAFQKGLAAMLITDMSKIKSLKVVERLRLQTLFQEMKLGQTGLVDDKTAPRVGHLLGAENLLVGNMTIGSLLVNSSIVSTSSTETEGSATIEVEKEQFYELPKLIVADYARVKKIKLTPEEMQAIGIPHTKVYQSFVYYGEGLDAMDEGRWQDAKNLFSRALEADPKFDLAQDGLDSLPPTLTPNPEQILLMSIPQLSECVETSINEAETAQRQADDAAAEAARIADSGDG